MVLAIFNSLGGGEVIAILVIALIVLGPDKLPEAIRKFGNIYGELRRMGNGFQSELRDAFDEPMRELRGTARSMQDAITDPVQSVTNQMKAPVIGGGAAAAGTAPDGAAPVPPVEEVQAPIEEAQVPVEDEPTEVAAGPDEPSPVVADSDEPVGAEVPAEVVAAEDRADAPAPDRPTEQAG